MPHALLHLVRWVRDGFPWIWLSPVAKWGCCHGQTTRGCSHLLRVQKTAAKLDYMQLYCQSTRNTCGSECDLFTFLLLLSVMFSSYTSSSSSLAHPVMLWLTRVTLLFSLSTKGIILFLLATWPLSLWASSHCSSPFLHPSTEIQPHLQTPVLLSCPNTAPSTCTRPMFIDKV